MALIKELLRTIPQIGTVEWLSIRPAREEPVQVVESITIDTQTGIVGDHFAGRPGAKRQVTLIQAEHIPVIAAILQLDEIDPTLLRRNIVVRGINLQSLRNVEFHIGDAILSGTGDCAPCNRMETNLGPGGYNAMRGHGGITARVVQSGKVGLGDQVKLKAD